MADRRVHPVGEVDRGAPRRQRAHVALGGEDEDLVLEDVDLHGVDEGLGVEQLLLPVHEQAEPAVALVETHLLRARLVVPVGGHPVLGGVVHLHRPDLHLDGLSGVGDHGGVERLVAIALGHRDVVLEAARNRLPEVMDHAQGAVAVLHRVHHHAHRHQVVDLLEFLLLAAHLVDDAVDVLGSPAQLGAHSDGLQLTLEDLAHVADKDLALLPPALQPGLHGVVAVGVELGEGQILQLRLELPDAEPVGERRVDVEGLLTDPPAPLLGVGADGAHVVKPVGELDEHHADVLGHGHQHLPDVLRLGLFTSVDVDLAELGDPLDETGDGFAELAPDLVQGDVGVLDRVVEQCCGEGLGVQAQLAEEDRRRQGVLDVGLPGKPELPKVSALGHRVGAVQHPAIGLGEVGGPGLEIGVGHGCPTSVPGTPLGQSSHPGARLAAVTAGEPPPLPVWSPSWSWRPAVRICFGRA